MDSLVMYIAGGYYGSGVRIKPVKVERVSDASVWIGGHRRARRSEYQSYYSTWQEAASALITAAESKVADHQRYLDDAQERLTRLKAELAKGPK